MKNNNNNNKPKKKFSRKLIITLVYLVVLPITLIVTFCVMTYNNNKITPFSTEATKNEVVRMKGSDFDKMTFVFEATDYMNASATTIKFRAAATDEKVKGTISSIKFQVEVGSNWIGYLSSASSSATITYSEDPASLSYRSASVTGITQSYPKRKLLFINVKAPTAYVYLTFTGTNNGETTNYYYILSYPYSQYFKDTTLGGI